MQVLAALIKSLGVVASSRCFSALAVVERAENRVAVVIRQLVGRLGPAIDNAAVGFWESREDVLPRRSVCLSAVGVLLQRQALGGNGAGGGREDHHGPAALFGVGQHGVQELFFVGLQGHVAQLGFEAALLVGRGIALERGDGTLALLVGKDQTAKDKAANAALFPGVKDALVVGHDRL